MNPPEQTRSRVVVTVPTHGPAHAKAPAQERRGSDPVALLDRLVHAGRHSNRAHAFPEDSMWIMSSVGRRENMFMWGCLYVYFTDD